MDDPISLYMDVHVPNAVADELRLRGVDLVTAREDGHATADDEILLRRATGMGRALVTHDRDFLQIADAFQRSGELFAGIVLINLSRMTSFGRYIDELELFARANERSAIENLIHFLPL